MIKQQHHDKELEDSVLGIMLIEPISQDSAFNYFRENSKVFYDLENELIYNTMRAMNAQGMSIDLISVTTKLSIDGHKPTSGDKWSYILSKKAKDVHSSAHLHTWAVMLLELYGLRKKQEIAHKLINNEIDAFDARKMINEEMDNIMSFQSSDIWLDASQIMLELSKRRDELISGKIKPVPTGLTDVDNLLGGGLDVGFHVIGARPAMGKSAVCLSMIRNMAYSGFHVTLLNLEMPISQLSARFISMNTGIQFNRIYKNPYLNPEEVKAIDNQINDMVSLPIAFSKAVRFNREDVRYAIRNAKSKFDTKCVFIDYLQLIDMKGEKGKQRYELIGELSREIKLLSSELQIPIVALAQVNRESDMGADKKSKIAKISQLRESGNLEQDMDTGMIIDRPYKRGEIINEHGEDTRNVGYLDIQKHRNGEERTIELYFDEKKMLFCDKSGEKKLVSKENAPF